ncbi:MAG TPA: hypothetical protein VIG62_18730 [Blastocatellia bacterium]|jgi:hypothetical protein
MARGWESKSVEEQISAAEAKEHARSRQEFTVEEIERKKKKEGLLMERARLLREMRKSHKRRYLVLLERALTHVESELAKLEPAPSE